MRKPAKSATEQIIFEAGAINNKYKICVEYEIQEEPDSRDTAGSVEVYLNEAWYLGRNIINLLTGAGLEKIKEHIIEKHF